MNGSDFAISQAFLNRFGTRVLENGTLKKKETLIQEFGNDMQDLINQFEEGGVHIA